MSDYSELIEDLLVNGLGYGFQVAHLTQRAAKALEAQAKEISQYQVDVNEALLDCKSLRARIAELEAAIEPFRQVKAMLFRQIKAITSIYEYVPVEALRDDGELNFKMTGAEIKRIYAALKGEKNG